MDHFGTTSFGFWKRELEDSSNVREENDDVYDVSSNVNIDNLIPGNTGIKIPTFVSHQRAQP